MAFRGNQMFVGNFSGFNTYDISNPKRPEADRLGRLPRRPGGRLGARQPAVHVGRADARPDRLRHAGVADAGQPGALPRRSRSSTSRTSANRNSSPRCRRAAARTRTRCSSIPDDKANVYIYGSGTGTRALGGGARRLLGARSEGGSEHGALQHRRDPGAARGAAEREDRQPSAHLRRSEDRRRLGTLAGRRPRARDAEDERDQPVPRHHGVSGGRPGGGCLLGQRHPARYLGSGEAGRASTTSSTRTSPTGTRRRSTTTARR